MEPTGQVTAHRSRGSRRGATRNPTRGRLGDPRLTLALIEAQVGALFDVLPIGLLVTAEDGTLIRVNHAALELFRAARAVPGVAIHTLLPFMDDRDTVESIRGAVYAGGHIRPVDVRLRRLRHAGECLRLHVVHG